jgi:enoyl-CoA hydratase/carnithine racemase
VALGRSIGVAVHLGERSVVSETDVVVKVDVPGEAEDRGELVAKSMDGAVAVLTMQHAPYNLLDAHLDRAIIDALHWAQAQGARAAILRSSLRHFSAGADLDQMLAAAEQSDILEWHMVELLQAFDAFPAPIVASVHGVCVGGGFELALASDLIIAASSSKIGSVEATVGLHPLMGGIQRVTQRAGAARAKEMVMLGRRYDAQTLERWGVINKVVPDEQLEAATMVLAQELAHGPTVCHAATKQLVSIAIEEGVAAADLAMGEIQRAIYRSQDFRAGVASYRENGLGMARFEGR